MYLLLICKIRDINSISRGNALAPNRRNSVPCTVRTSRQRLAIKVLFVCNSWDLEPLDLLIGLALGCYQPSPEVLFIIIDKTAESFRKDSSNIYEHIFHNTRPSVCMFVLRFSIKPGRPSVCLLDATSEMESKYLGFLFLCEDIFELYHSCNYSHLLIYQLCIFLKWFLIFMWFSYRHNFVLIILKPIFEHLKHL